MVCNFRWLLVIFIVVMMPGVVRAEVFEIEILRALENSPVLKAARQNLRSAEERLLAGRSSLELTTELKISGTGVDRQVGDTDEGYFNTGSVALEIKKPLYDGGIANAETDIRKIGVDEARVMLLRDEEGVLRQAINTYVMLVIARDRVALEESNVRRLEEYQDATQLRLEIGDATRTEEAAASARLSRANASLINARTEFGNAEQTYRVRMQLPDAGALPQSLSLPRVRVRAPLPQSAQIAGEVALEHNLSHRLAYLAERKARRNLDLLVANVRPKIDLSLNGRKADSEIDTRDSEEVSTSITLTMPLFPNKTVKATTLSTVAEHQKSVFNLTDSARNTRLNAENAYRQYQATQQVIAAFEAELEAAKLLRDGTQTEVEFGLKTLLDQLDAEQDFFDARINLLLSERDAVITIFDLLASIGALTADNLGIQTEATSPDKSEVDYPVVLRPLPVLDYPE